MIEMRSDGGGWEGTFALAVGFVATDALSDGAPVDVKLTDHDGKAIHGQLTRCENGTLLVDGRYYHCDDVATFRVE